MNSLSKLQLSLVVALLAAIGGFFINEMFFLLALICIGGQVRILNGQVKKEYPEDWQRYAALFTIYEILIVAFILLFKGIAGPRFMDDPGNIYNLLLLILASFITVWVVVIISKRKHTYGEVLFVHRDWAGVRIRGDIFSNVNDGDYAVTNNMKTKLKKGERVRISVEKGGMDKPHPHKIIKVMG